MNKDIKNMYVYKACTPKLKFTKTLTKNKKSYGIYMNKDPRTCSILKAFTPNFKLINTLMKKEKLLWHIYEKDSNNMFNITKLIYTNRGS